MLDIDGLMASLADRRKVFHSEADFQHALAWQIHEAAPESQVRLEVSVVPVEAQRMSIDIWLPVERIAIELKYVTRRLEVGHNGESFDLRNHGAQDTRRYDFLLDIQRLELMRSTPELCRAGHAVLLTNDPLYWSAPRRWDTVDAAFRVHEGGAISGELAWAADASPGTVKSRESPIEIQGSYRLGWQEYSNFPGKSQGRFRYLAVSVK